MNKYDIRKIIINKRNDLTKKEISNKSEDIFLKLKTLDEYSDCKIIMCYSSISSEVQTNYIIEDSFLSNKIVALPKVENDLQMSFHVIKSRNDLRPGYKKILEPLDNKLDEELIKDAIMIVPGSVFSKEGYRMGYGKGYYDRFIEKYKPKITIGLAFELQISDDIIINKWDQKLDMIITEKEIYK